MPARNLVNLKSVGAGYGARTVLEDVTLGVEAGQRIGLVGDNGAGKSTLMRLIAGLQEADAGTVTRTADVSTELVTQRAELDPAATIREVLVGARADHEWAGDARFRGVLDGLLGGVTLSRFPDGIETVVGPLSGGEQRRIALAHSLIDSPELLLLDEPTNHLDVEGIAWLARFLAARRGTLLVVTHDRWFLDEVCEMTWEVSGGTVHQYDGGYSAYTLARVERDRQAAVREETRRNLARKELAWLRRGVRARTTKPKFRIEAADALIADVPPPRDTVELMRFSTARLGDRVIDAESVSVTLGERRLLRDITWLLGPGQRIALLGPNGAGKTTLLQLLAGERTPDCGRVTRGSTVRLGELSQETTELPAGATVIQALQQIRGRIVTATGEELTAGKLAERFGFGGEKLRTRTEQLSGGERRRLALMRLLMTEPNVLILDEPTNDLDIDTLTALEDLLDGWPGTLLIVSHDRYFVERVCDDVWALPGDGGLRHLPGGVEQYLQRRGPAGGAADGDAPAGAAAAAVSVNKARRIAGAQLRDAQKELTRLERAIERSQTRDAELQQQMAAAATDPGALRALSDELATLSAERDTLESRWVELADALEDEKRGNEKRDD